MACLFFKLKQAGVSGILLILLKDFLSNQKQRVTINDLSYTGADFKADVPQGSILESLLFLIYINDLPDNLLSNRKLFADVTSLFSIVHDINCSINDLNDDLFKIRDWAFRWNMSFKPDFTKQSQKVIFSQIHTITLHYLSVTLFPNRYHHKSISVCY